MASTALLATGCLTAALRTTDDVVTAKSFVLVDEDGRPRAGLGCEGDSTMLGLWNSDGSEYVALGTQVVTFEPMEPDDMEPLMFAWVQEARETAAVEDDDFDRGAANESSAAHRGADFTHYTGLAVACDDDGGRPAVTLDRGEGASALLVLAEEAAVLSLETGRDEYGTMTLGAGPANGAGIYASWNDETSFRMAASTTDASLELTSEDDDLDSVDEVEAPATIELRANEARSGSILVRDAAGELLFETPKQR